MEETASRSQQDVYACYARSPGFTFPFASETELPGEKSEYLRDLFSWAWGRFTR